MPALSQCLEGLHSAISPRSLTPTFSELRKVGAETRSISFSSCLITLEDGSVDSHIVDDGTSTCINEMTLSDEWEERVLDYVKYCHECWVYERVSLCVCVCSVYVHVYSVYVHVDIMYLLFCVYFLV